MSYTKTLTPAFETIGRRKRMTGVLAEVFDGTTLIHAQEYPSYSQAEIATDALVFDLLADGLHYSATELDASTEPEPTEEQGPCDDINQPIDRARCATCGGEGDCPDCDPIAAIEHQMYLDHLALLDMGFYAACAPATLLDPDYA